MQILNKKPHILANIYNISVWPWYQWYLSLVSGAKLNSLEWCDKLYTVYQHILAARSIETNL